MGTWLQGVRREPKQLGACCLTSPALGPMRLLAEDERTCSTCRPRPRIAMPPSGWEPPKQSADKYHRRFNFRPPARPWGLGKLLQNRVAGSTSPRRHMALSRQLPPNSNHQSPPIACTYASCRLRLGRPFSRRHHFPKRPPRQRQHGGRTDGGTPPVGLTDHRARWAGGQSPVLLPPCPHTSPRLRWDQHPKRPSIAHSLPCHSNQLSSTAWALCTVKRFMRVIMPAATLTISSFA